MPCRNTSPLLQAFLPLPADDGAAAQSPLDMTVRVRTLFVCGTDDEYLLCGRAYAAKQKQFVAADLATLNVACGHNLVDEAQCSAAAQVRRVTRHFTPLQPSAIIRDAMVLGRGQTEPAAM